MATRFAKLASAEWLRREYVDAGRSTSAIADEVGCHHVSVLRALERHGIPVRASGPPRAVTVVTDTFDELTRLVEETVAQLRRDRRRNPPTVALLAGRVRVVQEALEQADEEYAQRQALIDLASAALHYASTKPTPR